jgi:hypothetical protein
VPLVGERAGVSRPVEQDGDGPRGRGDVTVVGDLVPDGVARLPRVDGPERDPTGPVGDNRCEVVEFERPDSRVGVGERGAEDSRKNASLACSR